MSHSHTADIGYSEPSLLTAYCANNEDELLTHEYWNYMSPQLPYLGASFTCTNTTASVSPAVFCVQTPSALMCYATLLASAGNSFLPDKTFLFFFKSVIRQLIRTAGKKVNRLIIWLRWTVRRLALAAWAFIYNVHTTRFFWKANLRF